MLGLTGRHPHSQTNADSRSALDVSATRTVDPLLSGSRPKTYCPYLRFPLFLTSVKRVDLMSTLKFHVFLTSVKRGDPIPILKFPFFNFCKTERPNVHIQIPFFFLTSVKRGDLMSILKFPSFLACP